MYFIIGNLLRIIPNNDILVKHSQRLADCSMIYLKNCPVEHGEICKAFLPTLKKMVISYIDSYIIHFDDLMNYDILTGENNEWPELRTEASAIILNIARYTKEKLNDNQKEKIIRVILQMVNDIGSNINIQATAILTLNKYIDIISKMNQSVIFILSLYLQILCLLFFIKKVMDLL